jgi:hypothetical protein
VLPPLAGRPIRVELRASLGPHVAATHIPRRVILLDAGLLDTKVRDQPGEFERILVHEIFHFAWVRLSNQTRRSWEGVLAAELRGRVRGELGWSAEWRKNKLQSDRLGRSDMRRRTPAWRRYVCESFCDTSAWLCAGLRSHDEYTLAAGPRRVRRRWFAEHLLDGRPVPV